MRGFRSYLKCAARGLLVEGVDKQIDTPCAVNNTMDLNRASYYFVEGKVGFDSQHSVAGFFEVRMERYSPGTWGGFQNTDSLVKFFYKRFRTSGAIFGDVLKNRKQIFFSRGQIAKRMLNGHEVVVGVWTSSAYV